MRRGRAAAYEPRRGAVARLLAQRLTRLRGFVSRTSALRCAPPPPAVTDPSPTVRLVDGIPGVDGRLEVLQADGETWGSVCATDFTAVDAQVACNQLGLYDASPRSYIWGPIGQAPPVAMGDLACDGSEGRVEDCPHTDGAGCTGDVVGLACSAQFASRA